MGRKEIWWNLLSNIDQKKNLNKRKENVIVNGFTNLKFNINFGFLQKSKFSQKKLSFITDVGSQAHSYDFRI